MIKVLIFFAWIYTFCRSTWKLHVLQNPLTKAYLHGHYQYNVYLYQHIQSLNHRIMKKANRHWRKASLSHRLVGLPCLQLHSVVMWPMFQFIPQLWLVNIVHIWVKWAFLPGIGSFFDIEHHMHTCIKICLLRILSGVIKHIQFDIVLFCHIVFLHLLLTATWIVVKLSMDDESQITVCMSAANSVLAQFSHSYCPCFAKLNGLGRDTYIFLTEKGKGAHLLNIVCINLLSYKLKLIKSCVFRSTVF